MNEARQTPRISKKWERHPQKGKRSAASGEGKQPKLIRKGKRGEVSSPGKKGALFPSKKEKKGLNVRGKRGKKDPVR